MGAGLGIAIIKSGTAAASAAASAAAIAAAAGRFIAQVAASYAISALANSLLLNRQRRDGASDSLLGLPISNTDTGAPRVWAIGRKVRVPAHVMWQSQKVRDDTPSVKGKSGPSFRVVSFDCAFMLNDRKSTTIDQFIINDDLLYWATRNLISIRSANMTLSESGGQVTIAMSGLEDPDFALKFQANDRVLLSGFVVTAGNDPNVGYWLVNSVTAHTSTPSTIVLDPYGGQVVTGMAATGGSAFSPAVVTRIDDTAVSHQWTQTQTTFNSTPITIISSTDPNIDFTTIFSPNDRVSFSDGFVPASDNGGVGYRIVTLSAGSLGVEPQLPVFSSLGTSTSAGAINRLSPANLAPGYFPTATTSILPNFYDGNETQEQNGTIFGYEGVARTPAYRGTCYQVFDDFNVTNFGGSIPPTTEALLQVDQELNWGEAIRLICDRHGLPGSKVDVTGVTFEPFEGMYLRGPTRGSAALQQLLLAKQIATQERNGVLSFFEIDNADQVAIQNGDVFSDFGAAVGEQPSAEKVTWDQIDTRDLPTSCGIRFQDPDTAYGQSYEHFGIRHPSYDGQENREELDWRNLVLSRRQARDIATTVVRRAIINSRKATFTLPASYLHVRENDMLSWTDDSDNTHLVRVLKVEIGTNFLVRVEAVVERANINVLGSPVQSAAGTQLASMVTAAELTAFVIDAPPVLDDWAAAPGLHVGCAALPGSTFAGATLYMSQDSGNTWELVDTINVQHAIGEMATTLGTATPSETLGTSALTWDAVNTVDVDFTNVGPLPLTTRPEAEVLQGWNWFGVVDGDGQVVEVFAARDVTQNTATSYTLGYLLRGIRGTFQGCATLHAVGTRVVGLPFFYPLSGKFIEIAGLSMHQQLDFKFVVPGKDIATTDAVGIGTRLRNVQPFPVRDISESYDTGSNSLTVTAAHWTRLNNPPGTVGPYQIDEPYEAYKFTLYDPAGAMAQIVKTKSAQNTGSSTLRDPSVEFTSSELDAAGYTGHGAGTLFWIDVQQIGQYAVSPSVLQEL